MSTSIVSSKYQIVIPKELRRKFNIKPGQKLTITENEQGNLEICIKSKLDKYYGSVKGVWGDDPVAEIRKMRDEWEEHQNEINDLWQK